MAADAGQARGASEWSNHHRELWLRWESVTVATVNGRVPQFMSALHGHVLQWEASDA